MDTNNSDQYIIGLFVFISSSIFIVLALIGLLNFWTFIKRIFNLIK